MELAPSGDNMWSLLPSEVIYRLLGYCDTLDVFAFLETCKFFWGFRDHDSLWNPIFRRLYKSKPPCDPIMAIRLRLHYEDRWMKGGHKVEAISLKPDVHHLFSNHRTSCAFLDEHHILWGTSTGHVQIRTLDDTLVWEAHPHNELIWNIKVIDNMVYTLSNGNPCVGIFQIEELSLKQIKLIDADPSLMKVASLPHKLIFWVFSITDDFIVVGDSLGFIYIWDVTDYKFVKSFATKKGGLFAIHADSSSIYVGTTDGLFVRYDYEGNELVSVDLVPEQQEMIRVIEVSEGLLYTGSNCGMVQIWNPETLEIISEKEVAEPGCILNELVVTENLVYCTGVSESKAWLSIMTTELDDVTSFDLPFVKETRTGRIYLIDAIPGKIACAASSLAYIITTQGDSKLQKEHSKRCIIS
eukprot:TRINITY_DN961_c0_g2_i1.p1 TRINITY_DN961_c0_g2~~TRINITY_DN961_c0_g2_i1.p1  ORF type:complete len:412 (-),score=59.41 TRINITY_DN961_c0_g2_i1:20-1255(-)